MTQDEDEEKLKSHCVRLPEVTRDDYSEHVVVIIGSYDDDARCSRLDAQDALELARQLRYHAERLLQKEQRIQAAVRDSVDRLKTGGC